MASKNDRDFDLEVKNHYRVEAGQDSPYGAISYRVLTMVDLVLRFVKTEQIEKIYKWLCLVGQ